MDITFVTGNQNKLLLAEQILGLKIKHVDIDLDELQELDPIIIAEHKVKQGWLEINQPLFISDTSLYIECLNSFPGPLIKWFWERVGLEKICQMANRFNNYNVYNETIITYTDGKIIEHFTGRIDGTIPTEPRGDEGWGWDKIFIPAGETRTYAEMEPAKVLPYRSHKIALEKLKSYLKTK